MKSKYVTIATVVANMHINAVAFDPETYGLRGYASSANQKKKNCKWGAIYAKIGQEAFLIFYRRTFLNL